ncbi:M24 family metallopeptidase [candidate division KSB1 bacterium]|nr:M24 family metallopeptidase [candidate division KSB1 bacterium]
MKKSIIFLIILLARILIQAQTVDAPYEVGTWLGFRSAAVSHTFDDNDLNQLAVAVPLFNEFDFKLTLFTLTGTGTGWKNPNWTGLQEAVAQGMKSLGLMKGDMEEAVAQGAHALFIPHGLGHMMGLDVHDMENLGEVYVGYDGQPKSTQFGLKSLRLSRTLEPGFVHTIEPGIYFIPELIDMWKTENKFTDFINYDRVETYKDFGGIRNEEDFVITKSGARMLGKPIPKTIEEVEKIRS